MLVLGAAAWPFVYLTLLRFLRSLRGVEDIGTLLAFRLLALGLLVFLGILLLSNVIVEETRSYFGRAGSSGAERSQ